jgi:hypothetical protein
MTPTETVPTADAARARVWEIDTALTHLDGRRHELLAERGRLMQVLQAATTGRAAAPAGQAPWGAPAPGAMAPVRQEWTPRRVQNLLLGLGALLLAVAATVFGAVTYDRLGIGGRAAVLLALTAVAALAAPRLRTRGLGATAESVAAVTLALAALDAWGLRRLGVGTDLVLADWLPIAAASLAALGAGYAVATGLRVPRLASLVLAHVAGLLAVARLEPSAAQVSLLLSLFASVHLVAVAALLRRPRTGPVCDLLAGAALGAAVAGTAGLGSALVSVLVEGRPAALALAVCAVLTVGAVVAALPSRLGAPLATLPVPLLAASAVVLATHDRVADRLLPLVAACVALSGVGVAALLPGRVRPAVLTGGGVVLLGSVSAVAGHVVAGLLGPVTWLVEPWTRTAGAAARESLAPTQTWTGSAAVLAVLLVSAAGAASAGAVLARRAAGAAVAGALVLVALLLAPLGADAGHATAVAGLLGLAVALVAGADRLRTHGRLGRALLCAAAAPAVLAGCWSLADRTTTLTVLPALAVLAAVVAVRCWPAPVQAVATGLSGTVAGAALAAAGAARGMSAEQVAGLLLFVPAVLVGLARVAGPARRLGAELAAAALAVVAVLLAVGDVGWLSWTLAAVGLLALLGALDSDRRALAPVGGLLLTASSWVRLADAGVGAPEPYVVPLALLALGLGHLRVQRDPATPSQAAYGVGLGLLLLPSLSAALTGSGLARPLLLGAVALGVLMAGVAARLQAPLLFGAGTLAVLALDLLAPYASAVPRWTALAAAGTLLVVVGATFEQRRRDVVVLRERYSALQ